MARRIVAACIDRLIEFDTQQEAATYLEGMKNKKADYVLVNREEVNGKYRIRIKEQYNSNPMIED